MPNQPKTPLRSIRISDELWQAAQRAAAADGESISEIVRAALRAYVAREA